MTRQKRNHQGSGVSPSWSGVSTISPAPVHHHRLSLSLSLHFSPSSLHFNPSLQSLHSRSLAHWGDKMERGSLELPVLARIPKMFIRGGVLDDSSGKVSSAINRSSLHPHGVAETTVGSTLVHACVWYSGSFLQHIHGRSYTAYSSPSPPFRFNSAFLILQCLQRWTSVEQKQMKL